MGRGTHLDGLRHLDRQLVAVLALELRHVRLGQDAGAQHGVELAVEEGRLHGVVVGVGHHDQLLHRVGAGGGVPMVRVGGKADGLDGARVVRLGPGVLPPAGPGDAAALRDAAAKP